MRGALFLQARPKALRVPELLLHRLIGVTPLTLSKGRKIRCIFLDSAANP